MKWTRTSVAERACAELTDRPALEVHRVVAGPRTGVFRAVLQGGARVVVKLFAPDATHDAGAEASVLEAAAASGRVPVPVVVAHGAVSGEQVTALITHDVGAHTLGDAVRAGELSKAAALMRLAALLSALHELPPPAGLRLAPGIGEQVLSVARRCPPTVFRRLAPSLEVIAAQARTDRLVWCHGDLHLDNAVRGPDRRHLDVAGARFQLVEHVVDFEATTVEVPEYDLAQTLVTCDAISPPDQALLAGAYGHPVNLALLDACVVFQALRGWTYAAHGEGRDVDMWAARLEQALLAPARTERTPS